MRAIRSAFATTSEYFNRIMPGPGAISFTSFPPYYVPESGEAVLDGSDYQTPFRLKSVFAPYAGSPMENTWLTVRAAARPYTLAAAQQPYLLYTLSRFGYGAYYWHANNFRIVNEGNIALLESTGYSGSTINITGLDEIAVTEAGRDAAGAQIVSAINTQVGATVAVWNNTYKAVQITLTDQQMNGGEWEITCSNSALYWSENVKPRNIALALARTIWMPILNMCSPAIRWATDEDYKRVVE